MAVCVPCVQYAYQWTPAHMASYPLIRDDPVWRARDMVTVSCKNATASGGTCLNSISGGTFSGSAEVTLAAIAVAGAAPTAAGILYSVDAVFGTRGPRNCFWSPRTVTEFMKSM
jgi:hypothetical protein